MGWGDELIVSGQVRAITDRDASAKVVVRDRNGAVRKHDMWKNHPSILQEPNSKFTGPIHSIVNGPGIRPYIADKTPRRWVWKEMTCNRGQIFFSPEEEAFAARHSPMVVVEPNNKQRASPNKSWGWVKWNKLCWILKEKGILCVQLGEPDTKLLDGVHLIETRSFREACAVLGRARAAVLPEGGLHHAAAALGVPSVVIFGGYISPKQTGYASQTNLFTGETPCGMRIQCPHCAKAMAQITPERVAEELLKLL